VFTAPDAGTYALTGAFLGSQHNEGSTVAVVANGSVVFNSTVTSEGQVVPFNVAVTLAAGATVVFSAGPGGGLSNTGLSAFVTGPLPPAAATYDPAATFEAGFTSHSNPNGVWSYGYSSGFTAPVTLYNLTSQPNVHGPNAQYWSSATPVTATSSVQYNNGPLYNDGNVDISADGLTLVWFGSQYSDVVFTAPDAGTYAVTGAFLGSQNNVGSTVAVVAGGNVVFNSTVTSEGQVAPFDATVTLTAGSALVFSAGPGGGTQNTGLSAFVTGPLSSSSSTPTITLVQNAEGGALTIAPNTWVTLKGSNLAPAGDSRIWQASDFVNNELPTQLDGVSVKLNGENPYYISPTQINILTPPDMATGTVQVQAATNAGTSASFAAQAQAESPSFFIFGAGPYVAATHADGSLIGPTSLYPGQSTPAQPGETIVLYANGFGSTSSPVVSGSETQSGSLNPLPVVTIGKISATVQFAGLISPGLFQFNVVVPASTTAGDNTLTATYDAADVLLLSARDHPRPECRRRRFDHCAEYLGHAQGFQSRSRRRFAHLAGLGFREQ
jgi:uncharacterized protein (TIGR03437 family)